MSVKFHVFLGCLLAGLSVCGASCGGNDAPPKKVIPVQPPSPDPKPEPEPLHEWSDEEFIGTVEAEEGIFANAYKSGDTPGFSGSGYLYGFWSNSASVTITVDVPQRAMYRVKADYFFREGGNSHSVIINGANKSASTVEFPASNGFKVLDFGKYLLDKGANTITFQGGWGDVLIDKFSIYTAPRNEYDISPALVDPDANAETKRLYEYLLDNFGKKMISGFLERRPIQGMPDLAPVLYGWDFATYTEGYPWKWETDSHIFGAVDDGTTEKAIDWWGDTDGRGMVTFQWHWGAPAGANPGINTFYTENTTFSVKEAVKEGTEENRLVLRDIDAIAVQLKKLESAGVPVMWRPLHEAGGGWFWWGAEGSEACAELYNIIFDRLKNYHGIHNLIWVWSSSEKEWYPGNDKVDIVGYDSYPGEYNTGVQSFMFNRLYALTEGKKIIAMTENGPLPDPDACFLQDAPWAYFMSWNELLYEQNTSSHIDDVYHNENVISLKTASLK